MPRRQVIVVGGGLAGLAAGASLRARGLEATILEAGPCLGGRAVCADGADLAPQVVSSGDVHLHATLALGASDERAVGSWLRPCRWGRIDGGEPVLVDRAGGTGTLQPPGLPWIERRRLRRLPRILKRFDRLLSLEAPERAARLDDRSVMEFAHLYLGPQAAERFAAPAVASRELADADGESRVVWMLDLARRWGRGRGTLRVEFAELCRSLAVAGDRTGARVGEVSARNAGLSVSVEGEGRAETLEADAVVFAAAPSVALEVCAGLLTTPERSFLAGARSVPAIVAVLRLERAPVRESTWLEGLPCQESALASLLIEPPGPRSRVGDGTRVMAVVRPERASKWLEAPDEPIAAGIEREFEGLYPAIRDTVSGLAVHRFPRALPRFPVGRFRELARFRDVQRDLQTGGRRLFFAGDHLAGAHLEGAAASGLRAAAEVAAALA